MISKKKKKILNAARAVRTPDLQIPVVYPKLTSVCEMLASYVSNSRHEITCLALSQLSYHRCHGIKTSNHLSYTFDWTVPTGEFTTSPAFWSGIVLHIQCRKPRFGWEWIVRGGYFCLIALLQIARTYWPWFAIRLELLHIRFDSRGLTLLPPKPICKSWSRMPILTLGF